MSNSGRPHRRQLIQLPRPWDSPGKNTGVGCRFLLQCMKVKSESESLSRVRLVATPWTTAYQATPPMRFSRQEYWNGVPLPSLELKQKLTETDQFCFSLFLNLLKFLFVTLDLFLFFFYTFLLQDIRRERE